MVNKDILRNTVIINGKEINNSRVKVFITEGAKTLAINMKAVIVATEKITLNTTFYINFSVEIASQQPF